MLASYASSLHWLSNSYDCGHQAGRKKPSWITSPPLAPLHKMDFVSVSHVVRRLGKCPFRGSSNRQYRPTRTGAHEGATGQHKRLSGKILKLRPRSAPRGLRIHGAHTPDRPESKHAAKRGSSNRESDVNPLLPGKQAHRGDKPVRSDQSELTEEMEMTRQQAGLKAFVLSALQFSSGWRRAR